ncbi:MAG TPA: hypothetical protein VM120_04000 [Bryobacteraceae bacterium]|nr:hypothetical protein [Bryobacteraceae bacterium]
MKDPTGLPLYDAMCTAVTECHSELAFENITDIAICVKLAQNKEPERQATEVRIRAERGFKKIRARQMQELREAISERLMGR